MNPQSTCPRCQRSFHCGAHEPGPCACAGLRLSAETLALLRERYDRCLCIACLAEMNAMEQRGTLDDRAL